MADNSFICTTGLRRRSVSPNEYQAKRLNGAQIHRYSDGLAAAFLNKTTAGDRETTIAPPNLSVDAERTVYGVQTTTVLLADDDGDKPPQPSTPGASDVDDAAVQATVSDGDCWNRDDGSGGGSGGRGPPADRDDNCVDVKAVTKLRKLCLLLKTNVMELKTVYRKRCKMGYEYENWERGGLETGLLALEEDVLRLFDEMENMAGSRNEIKTAVKTYTEHEARYRVLRSLNKQAKLRNASTAAADAAAAVTGGMASSVVTVCSLLRKYLIDPCFSWMSASARANAGTDFGSSDFFETSK